MKIKFLGTGTSQGIPVIGSNHPVCLSNNLKDKRLRTSALITTNENKKILIDCGPDFRQQMLKNNETHIDAVLITHQHNDHIIGLDDLRPIIFKNQKNMPIYCTEIVSLEIQQRFPYAFTKEKYPGAPSFDLHLISPHQPFKLFNQKITPIPILHGELPIVGFLFQDLAYITDASFIDSKEIKQLKNIKYLIINCLRKEPEHFSHFTLEKVLEVIKKISPQKCYLTHISHLFGFHDVIEKELPENITPAYDGFEFFF